MKPINMRLNFLIKLLVLLLALSTNLNVSNAQSLKNGTNCSKVNSISKVGSKVYKCAKNPYVKPTRNTWTLKGCLTAYAMWRDAKQEYEEWIDLAKLAGAEGEKTMQDLQTSIDELEDTMKNVVCKRGA